jgi:hypothetical protein
MTNFDRAVENYETTYIAMEADPQIRAARKQIESLQKRLDKLCEPYESRLSEYESAIKGHVIELGESIKQGHLNCVYYKPRRSTSWKSVAEELDPPQELIEEHTKIGNPSVRIKWDMNGG